MALRLRVQRLLVGIEQGRRIQINGMRCQSLSLRREIHDDMGGGGGGGGREKS